MSISDNSMEEGTMTDLRITTRQKGDPMDLYTFLKRLPKVSLHVHLAGTVQPSTLVALAGKNGRPAALRPVYTTYFRVLADLARTLMRLFALALDQPEQFFDDKIDKHISRLRVRNYPAPTVPPKPGQLRAGTHSDYGSLTILKTEDKPGALQVYNKAGEWVDVPSVPGCFIVNLGDLMARWTNDTWVSTLHRVVNPPLDAADRSRRQSLVFFHNPNYDAVIACIPSCQGPDRPPTYPVTTSGEHLRQQFVRTQA
jgi:isopenicillin N synthase-like dioxygenase